MKRAAREFACIMAAALWAWAAPARADTIILRTWQTLTVEQGHAELSVELRNTGREAAHDVRVSASFAGGWTDETDPVVIASGAGSTNRIHLGALSDEAGACVALVRVRFNDAAGYPSSILAAAELARGELPYPPPVKTTVKAPADLRGRARIAMTLASSAAEPLNVSVRFVTPDPFGGVDEHRLIRLEAGQSSDAAFEVANAYARPGSAYRVALLSEYEADGVRHARVDWARLRVPAHVNLLQRRPAAVGAAALALLVAFLALQRRPQPGGSAPDSGALLTAAVFAALVWFLADHLPPHLLFLDTTTAGGDTVAHHYLAGHLSRTLFGHGRIVSWAQGWWCGFPAFQFYFPLPYILIALLDLALPFNVAFKLVTVLGIFLLPAAAWTFSRRLRLPEPGPLLMAVATIPFLFDRSNTMWGANIYSTLAGMISNSLSFALMLWLLGSAARDADEGRFRFRTALLVAALIASHFFTSVMAALLMAAIPLLKPRAGFRRAVAVLAAEGALGTTLMAWWLVPLVAKNAYAVDFGENWPVSPWRSLPPYAWALIPFAVAALARCRAKGGARFVLLAGGLAGAAALLFFHGFAVSPVFVNVRLWPFMLFGLTALGAGGLGLLLVGRRHVWLAVASLTLAALSIGIQRPNAVRGWAEWNYSGVENKPRYEVLRDLVLPLAGTPGRLAYDMHPAHNVLGSSRVFELAPHLVGKPVVEGGIVNSAEGSLLAYYLQGETSDGCAGFPPMLRPPTFDMARAEEHLALLNVTHFIARSPRTRAAFASSARWIEENRRAEWTLYRARDDAGRNVVVHDGPLPAVRTLNHKQASLEWLYRPALLNSPVVILDAHDAADDPAFHDPMSAAAYAAFLDDAERTPGGEAPGWIGNHAPVIAEEISDLRIAFRTTAVGKPHILKIMAYPNWRVRGARRVYRVTPGFMMVIPEREEVELVFGWTLADRAGQLLSWCALAGAAAWAWLRRTRRTEPPWDPSAHRF